MDVQFEQTRKALHSKQRDLNRKGKGKKPKCFCCFKWGRYSSSVWKKSLGKFHCRSALKRGVVQQHNPLRVTRLQGIQRNVLGRCKTLPNFHRAEVLRIQWKRNQNSFRDRSSECESHRTENVCCAEQREMSIEGLQSLRRKATRGNENRRCAFLFGSTQCKIWLRETLVQKSSSRVQ